MKKLLFFLVATFSLQAEIVEISHLDEMTSHITPQTLIVFDIDNTIYHSKQYLGSDEWFGHRCQQHGLDQALSEWMAVQNITDVVPVEEHVATYIADLQQKGYTVMGLTTRGLGMALCTTRQLGSLGVHLGKSAPSQDEHFFTNGLGILYRQGILFTSGTHKGICFKKLMELIDYQPKRVVFINDKASHLKPVEEVCLQQGIDFTGLRYGYIDATVEAFRPEIADLQFKKFTEIISDEEAATMLQKTSLKK